MMINEIEAFCESKGYRFMGDYSGRFMFGRTCPGIICSYPEQVLVELAEWLTKKNISVGLLGDPRTDNMGMDFIVYFPTIKEEK